MAHFAIILFFLGLLAALGLILEFLLRQEWVAILAALAVPASAVRPIRRSAMQLPKPRVAA